MVHIECIFWRAKIDIMLQAEQWSVLYQFWCCICICCKYVSCTALCAGIIDDPDNSLFSYEEGKSWADYFDIDFTPAYQTTFTDPALEERAMEICGDDQFCVFDIAATEREEVGMSTMQGNLDLEVITELSQPGQCVRVCLCMCVCVCVCCVCVCARMCVCA